LPSEAIEVLHVLVDVLEMLRIPYAVGGSLASGAYGEPRSTHDIDVLIALSPDQVAPLAAALRKDFHVDPRAASEAVLSRKSFNVIHNKLYQKVDLFVAGEDFLDRRQLDRRVRRVLSAGDEREVFVTSAEDIVLRKLDWFRMTDETSERQWRDVLGVLKVRGDRMHLHELRDAADRLGLSNLLEQALEESGFRSRGG